MRFLLDENVAEEVGHWLQSKGYEVYFAREIFAPSAPDEVLAFSLELHGLIIITHDKDFRQLQRTLPQGHARRVTNGAGRISLRVPEPRARERLEQEWEVIEFHFEQARRYQRRFLLDLSLTRISVVTAPEN